MISVTEAVHLNCILHVLIDHKPRSWVCPLHVFEFDLVKMHMRKYPSRCEVYKNGLGQPKNKGLSGKPSLLQGSTEHH